MAIRYLSGINVDSNTLFVDDANNLVGIGTGSPAGSLHIQKNSGNYSNEAVKITGTPLSNVTDGTSATEGYGLYLSYNVSGNRQFVFADTVSGNGVRYIGTSLDGFNKITQTRQDLNLGTETNGVHVAGAISNTQFSVSNVNGTASKIVTEIKGAASQSANYLNISSSGAQGDIVSVFSSGNVGIGTTTDAGRKLDVAGNISLDEYLYHRDSAAQYLRFIDTSSIQLQSSQINFSLGSTSAPQGGDFQFASPNGSDFTVSYTRTGQAVWKQKFVNQTMYWENNVGSVVYFANNDGNVGIGTTNPSEKLHVSGKILQNNGGSLYLDANATNTTLASVGARDVVFEVNSANRLIIGSSGSIQLNNYGSGSKTGTVAYNLAVDSGGNIIETAGGVVDGSGTANYVSKWSDANTLTNSVIYENGGNIGIGVNDADYPLTVGSINVGGAGANLGIIINAVINTAIPSSSVKAIIGVTNSGFGYSAGSLLLQPRTGVNGVVAIATEGTEKLRVNQDGNVLIGTTTDAGFKLDVNGTSRSAGITLSGFATGTAGGNLELGFDGTHGVVQGYNRTSSTWLPLYLSGSDFRFNPSGTEFVRITSTGIGIGTTNPSGRLHVAGGDIVLNNTYSLYLNSSIGDGNWRVQKSSAPNITRSLVSGASLNLYSHFGTGEGFVIGANGGNSYYEILGSGPTHFFRGNVLIGTSTDAGYKLDVNGTGMFSGSITSNASGVGTLLLGSASGSSQIAGRITATESPSYSATGKIGFSVTTWGVGTDYGLTEVMAIDMRGADSKAPTIWMNPFGGNVGIGTTSPSYSLDVAGTSRSDLHIFRSNQSAPTADAFIFRPADNTVSLGTSNSERVRIASSEVWFKIGSSTTGYEASFSNDDNGFNIYASRYGGTGKYLTLNSTGAVENMRLTSNGNVLIGTTTDNGSKLQVAGSITSSANISLGNTSINPSITFTGTSIGGFTNGYISWGGTGVNTTPMLTISTPGSNLEIVTGYNERMVVSSGAGIAIFTNNGSGTYTNRFQLNRNGSINAGAYGSGSITGTPAYNLAVDASGNIIELPGGVVDGSGTANQLARWQDANTLTNAGIEDNGSAISIGRDAFYSSTNYGIAYAAITGTSGGTAWFDTVTVSGVRLYNITIFANPNINGSSSYRDFYYGKIIIGTGYNGSAVVDFINYHQESPQPRSLYGSGGGNLTVTAVFVYGGSEVTEVPNGATYTIRIKIAGYNGAGAGTQINLQRIM